MMMIINLQNGEQDGWAVCVELGCASKARGKVVLVGKSSCHFGSAADYYVILCRVHRNWYMTTIWSHYGYIYSQYGGNDIWVVFLFSFSMPAIMRWKYLIHWYLVQGLSNIE